MPTFYCDELSSRIPWTYYYYSFFPFPTCWGSVPHGHLVKGPHGCFALPDLGLKRGWLGGTLVIVLDTTIYVIEGDSPH